MIYSHLITAGLSAALAFGSAWQVQSWLYTAEKVDYENKTLAQQAQAQSLARTAQERQAGSFAAATSGAQTRAIALRHDADNARTALDSLRRASADAVVTSTSGHDACLVRAVALSELLANCSDRYQSLGEKADRHVSDLKTLTDAWPKKP